jgi:hypothetical protein
VGRAICFTFYGYRTLGPARDFAESQLAFILRLKQGRVPAAARVSINVITPAVLAMRRCRVPRPGLSGLEVGRLAQELTNEPPVTNARALCALRLERHGGEFRRR